MSERGSRPGSANRERGYLVWSPRSETRKLLDDVLAVFEEYEAQRPLTIRQIFYRLVGAYGYEKGEALEKKLSTVMWRGRRSRDIPFDWVRDDGIRGTDYGYVLDAPIPKENWLESTLGELRYGWTQYRVPSNCGQPRRVEVWCEAAGMVPQLKRLADRYLWPVFSGGGAESMTARYELAQRCARQPELPTVVLHIGDHDVDGVDIFNALADDTTAFLAEDGPDAEIEFVRVAVTPDQIGDEHLPTYPLKPTTDKKRSARYDRWYAAGYEETCQAEALPPDRLAEIVTEAIERYTDLEVMRAVRRQEQEARDWLGKEFEERFGKV